MALATLDRLQQSMTEQLYAERALLVQLVARLAGGCGYDTSLVPEADGPLVYLSIALPTGTLSVGLPPEAVRLAHRADGPAPVQRQTMRQRADVVAAFLDASA